MFLFTTNVTGVEVPPENLRAGYQHVKAWDPRQKRQPTRCRWPWGETHPQDYAPSTAEKGEAR
jgi:hypothetical protein